MRLLLLRLLLHVRETLLLVVIGLRRKLRLLVALAHAILTPHMAAHVLRLIHLACILRPVLAYVWHHMVANVLIGIAAHGNHIRGHVMCHVRVNALIRVLAHILRYYWRLLL